MDGSNILKEFEKVENDFAEARQIAKEATELAQRILSDLEKTNIELAITQRNLRDCRNELCLKCGKYENSHLGACNGCRWEN